MWDRVLYRLRQFWFVLFSRMTEEDRLLVHQHLNRAEAALFFNLPEFEQKHGVVVARKLLEEAAGIRGLDQKKLLRLGLLHDVGKSAANLSILDKGLLVILRRLAPPLYNYLAEQGKSNKALPGLRKFYVHKHHGEVGAELLSNIGESQDIIEEIKRHDRPYPEHDIYLRLLDLADSTF